MAHLEIDILMDLWLRKILNNIKVYDEMFQQWSNINWEQAKEEQKI